MQYTDEFLNVYRHESGSKHSYFDQKNIVLTTSCEISIELFSVIYYLFVQH